MVIRSLEQEYSVLYRNRTEQNFEILICKGRGDLPYTLLRFYQNEDIHWLLEQNLLKKEITGNFEDYKGSFLWQDNLIMVFLRREGISLSQWLKADRRSLSQRLEVGKRLLERLLLLNMPEYLLVSILNETCILVTEASQVVIRYEPVEAISKDQKPEKELGTLFYQIFLRLFQKEAAGQTEHEIPVFLKQMQKEPYQDIFHIYQCYDRLQDGLTGKADRDQPPLLWKERLILLGERIKQIGEPLLVPVLLAVGMAVLIYGICCPAAEEKEEFRFERIGTLEIPMEGGSGK